METKRVRFNELPISPVYPQMELNQKIDLGTLGVQFDYKNKVYEEQATVYMDFLPRPKLFFVLPHEAYAVGWELFYDKTWNHKLSLKGVKEPVLVLCNSPGNQKGGPVFLPLSSVVRVSPSSDSIYSAVFHVFNFPMFWSSDNYVLFTKNGGNQTLGRVTMKADGWVITIIATNKTRDFCKALDREGGFVVTHVGEITREDGSTFSSEQLADLVNCCHYFLSFALGRWAGVAFPVGYDNGGNRVFEQWGLPSVAEGSWSPSCSWFNSQRAEMLTEVFPGFMKLWKSGQWHDTLCRGLYWYVAASGRGTVIATDTGLILAQTALELLAWTYGRVCNPKHSGGYGSSAAGKIRQFLDYLKIPTDIPQRLGVLRGHFGNKAKGPNAIARIRNSFVHPKKGNPPPEGAYFEVWLLSLWYLDLVLLCLCGHVGEYANRLDFGRDEGTVEQVPYAKKSGTP